jgi:hypothetical protein
LYGKFTALQDMFNVKLPATFRWGMGLQQMASFRLADFAVLSAWSMVLDLEVNLDKLTPHDFFTRDARRLFQTVV